MYLFYPSRQNYPARIFTLTSLALLILVWLPGVAEAQWTNCGTDSVCNTNSGNTVITSSTTPSSTLNILGPNRTVESGNTNQFIFSTDASSADRGGSLSLGGRYNAAGGMVPFGYIWGRKEAAADGENGYLSFGTRRAGGPGEWMRITSAGRVGIGTPSPNQRLGVQGMLGLYPQEWSPPTVRGMFMYHGGGGGSIYAYNYPASTGDPISITASRLDFATYVGANGYQRLSITNDGKVGIGTASPAQALDVVGTVNASGGLCIAGVCKTDWSQVGGQVGASSQWATTGSNLYFNTGNIGLGTPSPAFKLDSAGSIRGVGENSVNITNQYAFTGGGQQQHWSQGFPKFGPLGRGGARVYGTGPGEGTNPGAIFIGGGGVDQTGGAAGVFAKGGDTGPQEWNLAWGGVGLFAQGGQNGPGGNNWAFSRYAAAAFFNGYVQIGSNDGRESGLSIGFDGYNGRGAIAPSGGSLIVSGSVGVGLPAPAYKLDVQGQVNASGGLCIAGVCKADWSQVGGASQWGSANSGAGVYYGGGNVGIGTADPSAKLHVESGFLWVGDRGDKWGSMLRLSSPGATTMWDIYNESASGRLRFYDVTHKRDVLTLEPSGDVSTPANLNVGGTVTGGNIQVKYQDVAEWVPSTQDLQAGTVVVLDPQRVNQVITSLEAYDTSVAGVISAQPGISLGEAGEGKVLVATTGRVRVKVDATRSPVRIGDLLVTSDKAGVAMKSEPISLGGTHLHRPGTIIGKALESLDKGTGEILVLLSLQ